MKIRNYLSVGILTLMAGIASAGLVISRPVVIDLDNRTATGDQQTARIADNDVEYIGCGIKVFDDGVNPIFSFGFCQAGDGNGQEILCFSQNTDLLDAMKGTSAFAWIRFSWRDSENFPNATECSSIQFSTQSFYLPDRRVTPPGLDNM